METVDCQGFQLSRYAAGLAERERIEQSQQAADFVRQLREAGERMRNEE
jgi:hypothetical protein